MENVEIIVKGKAPSAHSPICLNFIFMKACASREEYLTKSLGVTKVQSS